MLRGLLATYLSSNYRCGMYECTYKDYMGAREAVLVLTDM
jgi:hypothetical protein